MIAIPAGRAPVWTETFKFMSEAVGSQPSPPGGLRTRLACPPDSQAFDEADEREKCQLERSQEPPAESGTHGICQTRRLLDAIS
jgi:hypothetical protein